MKKITSYTLTTLMVLFALTKSLEMKAQSVVSVVSDEATLVSKFSLANPGDTIIVANGTYDWGQINLVNTKGTSSSAWIVLKSQTPNGVVFTGTTYLQFGGKRILVTGFKFANGNSGANDVIQFRSSSSNTSSYCRLTNITIDRYNSDSTGAAAGLLTAIDNKWVSLFGTNNRLDHCTFINKSNSGATVVVWYDNAVYPLVSTPTYHLIDSNYFKGRTFISGNGGETIRLGTSQASRSYGYNVVEYNLFEGLTQSEPEIISNKTNANIFRYNTILNSRGGITMRHGRYCSVYGNFIINNNPLITDAYGIRLIDKGHKVYNNYIEGTTGNSGSLTSMRAPISLYNGFYASSDTTDPAHSSGYWPADSCTVAFNTIVDAKGGGGILIGHTDGGLNLYQPTGMIIANNIIKMSAGQAAYINPANTALTYFAEGNVYSAPNGLGITNTAGFTSSTLTFGARANGIQSAPSNVQDAALNGNAYAQYLNNLDAQGQTRSSIYDIGSDEINGSGNVLYSPLDSTRVGAGTPLIQNQTITFGAIASKVFGAADFSAGATASSGLTVSYTSSNTAVATIVNGLIHIVGAGTSTITASQSGNANYNAASDVSQTLTVNPASQTITFGAITSKVYGAADFNAGATVSSGLTVSYTSSNTAVATIVNGLIRIVGAGTSIITASQSGNTNYNAASDVSQTLTVNPASQTITFGAIASKVYGAADFDAGATATSGLTVSYASSNTAVATIVNGLIRIVGAGTSVITASQSGSTNYSAAANVSQTLTVTPASQTITFGVIASKVFGAADFSAGATASSGLTVSYTSSNTAVATIVNGLIRIVGAGTSIITASQSGNTNYSAAANVSQTLTVTPASQTITFGVIASKVYGAADFSAGATASSGLTVSYTSSNTAVATIVNGLARIVGVGTSTITASQSGSANYSAATNVLQTLTVNKASQTITFGALPTKVFGNADFSAGATASSGLTVTYTSSNTAVATIVSGLIRIVGVGTSTITASQSGNTNYNAATNVLQTLTVSKASQTITFPALPAKVVGDADFSGGATASSALSITYSSSNTAVATIVSGNIRIVAAGTAVITASQSGNTNYNAATSVSQTLTVGAATSFNYSPSATTITSGRLSTGVVGNMATNNSSYYVVSSTTSGTRVLDWYGSVKITQTPASVTKLTINYDGKNSASKTQVLYLYNWVTAAWVQIDSRSVTTTDISITNTQTAPANYISSLGEIRLRVYSTGGTSNYTCSADWMQFVVTTSPTAKLVAAKVSNALEFVSDARVIPNPNNGNSIFQYRLNEKSAVNIELFNSNGILVKKILSSTIQNAGAQIQNVKMNDCPTGIYFIKISSEKQSRMLKFIINR